MIGNLYRRLREEAGFTLSEMLTVLAIMGIILAALALGMSLTITQSSQIQEQSTLQTETRAAIDRMARELRQGYTGDTTFPIKTATATSIEFLSPDKGTPFRNRRIAYRLTGGHIDRAQTTSTNTDAPPWTGFTWTSLGAVPASEWAQRVPSVTSSTLFTYYGKTLDSSTQKPVLLTGTIDPTLVGQVGISATVMTKTGGRQYTYSTSVSLRWAPA
jgi:prepilin-type N-terminal cleavage/methylation domain-containing protein